MLDITTTAVIPWFLSSFFIHNQDMALKKHLVKKRRSSNCNVDLKSVKVRKFTQQTAVPPLFASINKDDMIDNRISYQIRSNHQHKIKLDPNIKQGGT
ncbi:MAG: hypothetical protein IAF02_17085 [Anaerolineae bacterium]|nr:hypothetical protein [Anaerolineae bacterium]